MTDREAFVSGIRIFCKRAGLDAEDTVQLERVLFMPPERAEPIVKAASVTVRSVEYVRAGEKLAAVDIQSVLSQLQGQGVTPADLRFMRDWATKQEQAAQLQQAQQAGTVMKGIGEAPGGKAREYFKSTITGQRVPPEETAAPTPPEPAPAEPVPTAPAEDPAAEAEARYREAYERSPFRQQMPFNVYSNLKGQYEQAKGFGGEVVPEDIYIGGQWAATNHQIQRRMSRRVMRGLGLDMAPGQLARMSDQDIAARTDDPSLQAAFRNARDLARSRQRLQGGVAARIGTGLGTGAPAERAAEVTAPPVPPVTPASTAPTPVTAPTPSPVPQTSASPAGDGGTILPPSVTGPPASTAPSITNVGLGAPTRTPAPMRPWTARGEFGGFRGRAAGGGGGETERVIEPNL